MPDLYLALDLDGTEEAVASLPDAELFAAARTGDILLMPQVQGDGFTRTWRAFPGTPDGKFAAQEYARQNPTLVVVPLDMETVPLKDLP